MRNKKKVQKITRPGIADFWLMQALIYSTRGTCDRLRTACLIVDEHNHLISAGYNGSLPGAEHCDDVGHLIIDNHCMRTLHAEENAILHSTKSMRGATAYMLASPCLLCTKKLLSVGVKKIVCAEEFKNMQGKDVGAKFIKTLLTENNVPIEFININFTEKLNQFTQILKSPGGFLRSN